MTDGPTIEYSLKDVLEEIRSRVQHIDAKLDTKADETAVRGVVVELQALALKLERLDTATVKKDGPIVIDFRKHEQIVRDLRTEMLTKDQVTEALREHRGWAWSTASKVLLSFAAFITTISTAVAIYLALKGRP